MREKLHERYVIERLIGKGGMAEVFLIYDERLHTNWAMKRLPKDCHKVGEQAMLESFRKEVELLSSLRYAGIPRITDQFEDDLYYYVVMDYIVGQSLAKMLENHVHSDEKTICSYMERLIHIFLYLHGLRPYPVLYLDLKPQNIVINEQGQVFLIDFGSCCYKDGLQKATSATPRVC